MKTILLPSPAVSTNVRERALASLNEVIDLHKIRTALYARIASHTDDAFLKTFFQRMANDSRRFRTELCIFTDHCNQPITEKVVSRTEAIWEEAATYLRQKDMIGLLQTWQSLEEIMIDAYLKVAANMGVRGNFRKVILRQIDALRKDRNIYRFMESIFLQQLQIQPVY